MLGMSEVHNLEIVVRVKNNVFQLQVAMEDTISVEMSHSLSHLGREKQVVQR